MKEVTVGIIGAGFAAGFHSRAYGKISGVPIRKKAIADVDIEKARSLANSYGFEEFYEIMSL